MAATAQKRSTTKRTNVKAMTSAARLKELQTFIRLCFVFFEDMKHDDKEIANLSGLSQSTVWRMRAGMASLHTKFGTIQALGIAAGLQLTADNYKMRVALVKE